MQGGTDWWNKPGKEELGEDGVGVEGWEGEKVGRTAACWCHQVEAWWILEGVRDPIRSEGQRGILVWKGSEKVESF